VHDKIALVVVGVHRSGTSAITRLLNLLGARLPKNLMPPLEGVNDRGFWESTEVQELNDEALASAGSSWDDLMPIPEDWFESPMAERFRARTEDLLARHFAGTSLFVLKDPRLCRLLPLWHRALDAFGADSRFVHIFRNPVEVAASLGKRDGFETGKSHMLWLRYALSAERHTRGHRRTFLSFDKLLRDWPSVIVKISRDLEIDWPRSIEAIRVEVDRFLEPSERHHVEEDGDTSDVPTLVLRIYDTLLRLEAGSSPEADPVTVLETFDRVGQDIKSTDTLYGAIVGRPENRAVLEEPEVASKEQTGRLRDENRTLREELSRLRQQMRSRDFELGRRDRELRSLDRRVAELSSDLRTTRRSLMRLVRQAQAIKVLRQHEEGTR